MKVKYFKQHPRSKSHITFAELQKKANQVFEFGNDWGLYVDIEKCELNYDLKSHKFKYNISKSSIKEELEDEYSSEIIENITNEINTENSENSGDDYTIMKYLSIFSNKYFIKNILFGYGVFIVLGSTFILKYYMFVQKY